MTIDHKIPVSEHIYTNCKGLFYCLPNKFLLETLKIQRPFSFTKLKKISHSKYPISIHPSEKITLACITWLFFSHLAGPDGFFNTCTHHYARTALMQGFPVGARVINKLYMKKSQARYLCMTKLRTFFPYRFSIIASTWRTGHKLDMTKQVMHVTSV